MSSPEGEMPCNGQVANFVARGANQCIHNGRGNRYDAEFSHAFCPQGSCGFKALHNTRVDGRQVQGRRHPVVQ